MSILDGFKRTKKYRKTKDGYVLQSEWTSSDAVEMKNGNTLETEMGIVESDLNQKVYLDSSLEWIRPTGTTVTSLLTIDTKDLTSELNQPRRFYQITSDTTAIDGAPSIFPAGKTFYGIRYVHCFTSTNFQIELLEYIPVKGRRWFKQYTYSSSTSTWTWSDWTIADGKDAYHGTYTGNIDTLLGEAYTGGYWVNASDSTKASGTLPFEGTYFFLTVDPSTNGYVQRATRFATGITKYRVYTNSQWYPWTEDYLPLSGGTISGSLLIQDHLRVGESTESLGISMWADSEGGNMRIYAPSSYGNYWEVDAVDGGNLRFYTYDSSGALQSVGFSRAGAIRSATLAGAEENRVLYCNTDGYICRSGITLTELGYLDGVTSSIQTQLNNKASKSVATTSANGLMSSAMVTKLNGIATSANAYTLPTANASTKGGVTLSASTSSTSGVSSGVAATPSAVKAVMDALTTATTATNTTVGGTTWWKSHGYCGTHLTGVNGSNLGTLPTGYRPASTVWFTVWIFNGTGWYPGAFSISPAGEMTVQAVTSIGATSWVNCKTSTYTIFGTILFGCQ